MAVNKGNTGHYKLTQKQQKTVVKLAKQGVPFTIIAGRFGITPQAISSIMTRFGFSERWRTKKIEKMKLEKIQLVKAELKKNPNIRAAMKKYGVSNGIFWYRGISLKNSKEFKIGKKLRPKFLKCKLCGASLENNRFDRSLMCKECGRQYNNELSRKSHRKRALAISGKFRSKHNNLSINHDKYLSEDYAK